MREVKFRAWNKYWKEFEEPCYDVTPDNNYTYQEFTGYTDHNGKEIYEGDIIHVYGNPPVKHIDFVDHKQVIDDIRGVFSGFGLTNAIEAGLRITVIGNIYENPELLDVDINE